MFVQNTTVHKTTRATPFSLMFGAECRYLLDLFYQQQPGWEPMEEKFVEELTQIFRGGHQQARAALGANQRRQEDTYYRNVRGDSYSTANEVWLFCKDRTISKKFNLPWEGPLRGFGTDFWRDIQNCERTRQKRALAKRSFQPVKAILCFRSSTVKHNTTSAAEDTSWWKCDGHGVRNWYKGSIWLRWWQCWRRCGWRIPFSHWFK